MVTDRHAADFSKIFDRAVAACASAQKLSSQSAQAASAAA
jgi:hypothetical protein